MMRFTCKSVINQHRKSVRHKTGAQVIQRGKRGRRLEFNLHEEPAGFGSAYCRDSTMNPSQSAR
jgi:hypothetical protein